MRQILFACLIGPALLSPTALAADPAEVTEAQATVSGDTWRFSVAILHAETGWDDYADGWRIETVDGTILGERPLAHPHPNEQPFTRSVSGVVIPPEVTEYMVRTRTNTDGWSDATFGPFPLNP